MSDKTPRNVYQAIAAVMAALGKEGIGKTSVNQQQNYRFRGIDAVYNALSPAMVAAGLVVLPRMLNREVIERTSTKGGALFSVTVEAEFDFVSVADGSTHTIKTFGEAMDSGDKATNKAMSAAYKYAAMQAFCIPTEGDNDADSTTHEVASPGAAQVRNWVGSPPRQPARTTATARPAGYDEWYDSLTAAADNGVEPLREVFESGTPDQRKHLGQAKIDALKQKASQAQETVDRAVE